MYEQDRQREGSEDLSSPELLNLLFALIRNAGSNFASDVAHQ